jgi:hypothetical protein
MKKVNSKEFSKEMTECIDCGVMSNRLGTMVLTLIDNVVHTKAHVNMEYDVNVTDELKGFILDDVFDKFLNKKRPDDDSKFLPFYFKMMTNTLINLRNRRLNSNSRHDLYGKGDKVKIVLPNGKAGLRKIKKINIDNYIDELESVLENNAEYIVLFLLTCNLTKMILG